MTIKTSLAHNAAPSLAWLNHILNALIDLFFPPHCVACHSLGVWLCANCLNEVETISPPVCQRCGLPSEDPQTLDGASAICVHCQTRPLELDRLRAYAFHAGPLRQAIHQFKYNDLRSLAGPLGQLMCKGWASLTPTGLKIDAIVPVPLHSSRQRQRGYNQAALLAAEIGAQLQIPVLEDQLIRTRATAPQVDLSAEARRVNVRDAFRCTGHGLSGKHVMLIDDVCTTGSTLESACAALHEAGAQSVWAYTLARAKPGPL